jgi:TonB-linked SusC/RagA family outer membrane protein
MKSYIRFTVLLVFSTLLSQLHAQGIAGKVSDEDNLPLPGVNINSPDPNVSAVTDFDGNFTINVMPGTKLKFSMVGYADTNSSAASGMKITLKTATKALDEVVVIGYGTKKKGAVTGSVSQIKSEDIMRTPAQSAIQGIQGKAAGINIVTNDEPGAKPSIVIRGLGTVLGKRNPLYVIDGLETDGLNNLNASDIATIDILKDAASLAIYGQKGSNGVIVISTKKGKSGDLTVSYDAYYGQKSILTKVKMADSYRFAYYNNTALGNPTYFNFVQPVNTNWLEEITRTGEVTSNAVSVSGGSEKGNYYLGLSHYRERGILIGTDFKRSNLTSRNEYKMSDRLKVSSSVNVAVVDNQPKPLSAFTNAYKQSPIVPLRYANGRFGAPYVNTATGTADLTGEVINNVGNPVAQLYNHHEKNKNLSVFGSLNAELKIYKDLSFTTNFGATADWGKGYTYTPNREIWLAQNPSLTIEDYKTQKPKDPINTLQQRRTDFYNWNWDNYLTYKKTFGSHDLTVIAGISRSTKHTQESFDALRYNVPEQSNYWSFYFSDDNSNISPLTIHNTIETPIVSLSYFGRLEYAFKNKYLLSATVRREGISIYQESKRWGVFPAASVGWIITNEDFMKDVKFINTLKLRGGYGEVGNGDGGSFNAVAFSDNAYPFGNPSVSQPGTYVKNAVDKNLTWETMKEVDLGLDFTILNNHLSGTFDYYNRKSEDIILEITPPDVLSEENAFANTGAVTNKGIEATLRWDDAIGDNLRYWIGGNFSKNQNEVSEINNIYFSNNITGSLGNGINTKMVKLGQPLGSFYVFEQTGYDSGGEPIFRDLDNDGFITDRDRVNAGSYIPKYTYGFNIGIVWKGVDLSVDTYGVGGNKVYNGKKAQRFGGENIEYDLLDDFWTPSNPNAENPKPFNGVPKPSTYYVEDGSYFRINNITLGYTLPKMIKELNKVRFYITAVNPFIFTNYSGYSPEVVGGDNANPLGTAGIELDAYPTNRSFLAGANISF